MKRWEVVDDPNPNDYRAFVTDGKESFHLDRPSAERLCDLLNAEAKPVRVERSKSVTK